MIDGDGKKRRAGEKRAKQKEKGGAGMTELRRAPRGECAGETGHVREESSGEGWQGGEKGSGLSITERTISREDLDRRKREGSREHSRETF